MSLSTPIPLPADIPGTLIEEEIIHETSQGSSPALEAYQRGILNTYEPAKRLATDATYLGRLLSSPDDFRQMIESAVQVLQHINTKFETIAFTGNSGAMFGPALALRLNKQLILVRKPGESSHSSMTIEGVAEPTNYIFVDDVIDSGATLKRLVGAIESNRQTRGSKLRAVYCYNTGLYVAEPGHYVANGVKIEEDTKTTRDEEIAL